MNFNRTVQKLKYQRRCRACKSLFTTVKEYHRYCDKCKETDLLN